jgi:hypothetical protein
MSEAPRARGKAAEAGPQVGATRARQGSYGRRVYWVLVASTALAVLALAAAWAWKAPAFHSANTNNGPEQSGRSGQSSESSQSFNAPTPPPPQPR